METLRATVLDVEHVIHTRQDKEKLAMQIDKLKKVLASVIMEINSLNLVEIPSAAPLMDHARLKSLLVELESKLLDDSPTALDTWHKLKFTLSELVSEPELVKLDRQIELFDLSEALVSLRAMMPKLNLV
jgi:hypothetical protein